MLPSLIKYQLVSFGYDREIKAKGFYLCFKNALILKRANSNTFAYILHVKNSILGNVTLQMQLIWFVLSSPVRMVRMSNVD